MNEKLSDIEWVLKNALGKDTQRGISKLAGKLSTNLENIDPTVDHVVLEGLCGTASTELQIELAKLGFTTTVSGSDNQRTAGHLYLTAEADDGEIVIDPTIGQYLKRHPHVYVGSRADLRALVVKEFLAGEVVIYPVLSDLDGEEIFKAVWGNTSATSMYNKRFDEQGTEIDVPSTERETWS